MPKIAVVLVHTFRQYEDSYSMTDHLIEHISDWTEVTDKERAELVQGLSLLNQQRKNSDKYYHLVEHVEATREFVSKTIDGYKEHMKKLADAEAKRKAEAQAKKEEREKKKAERIAAAKDSLVKELQRKIEELEKNK